MGIAWSIFSPLTPTELAVVEEEYYQALENFYATSDNEDTVGEVIAEGHVVDHAAIEKLYEEHKMSMSSDVRTRLRTMRSVLSVDRPGNPDVDALQTASIHFLLARIGKGLALMNDYPLITTEALSESIADAATIEEFGKQPRAPSMPKLGAVRAEKPGEVRSVKILAILESIAEDPDLAIDARAVLSGLDVLAQRYAALLYEEGAMHDAAASAKLNAREDELTKSAEALAAALRSIKS